MELKQLPYVFSVCKITDISQVDFTKEFVFLSKTDDEISLVCESSYAPLNLTACEPGWRALKISGILDFGMIGVIAGISKIAEEVGISIFVISTYNTDYILIKAENFDECVHTLALNGYAII